jgi:hypothetical protein
VAVVMMRSSLRSSGVRTEGDALRGDARAPARVRDVAGVAQPKDERSEAAIPRKRDDSIKR